MGCPETLCLGMGAGMLRAESTNEQTWSSCQVPLISVLTRKHNSLWCALAWMYFGFELCRSLKFPILYSIEMETVLRTVDYIQRRLVTHSCCWNQWYFNYPGLTFHWFHREVNWTWLYLVLIKCVHTEAYPNTHIEQGVCSFGSLSRLHSEGCSNLLWIRANVHGS